MSAKWEDAKNEVPAWVIKVENGRTAGESPFGVTWYAKPNDVIGGWCVMPVDKLPSEAGIQEVADVVTEAQAQHIAYLHNMWLVRGGSLPS